MDDRTAYEILNIKDGTSLKDINKKHDHFARLYRHYLMGERVYISSEKLEQMKRAYESLLYKRIEDEELKYLYPLENTGMCYQFYDKIICPFALKHKAKIIYTLVMCILTFLIISIMNYKPVDLYVTVYLPPCDTLYEYEYRKLALAAYTDEIDQSIPGVDRPLLDFQSYSPETGLGKSLMGLYANVDIDVFIMEEAFFKELQRYDDQFYNISNTVAGAYVHKESGLYRYVCDVYEQDGNWVAIIAPKTKHREEALRFLSFISNTNIDAFNTFNSF